MKIHTEWTEDRSIKDKLKTNIDKNLVHNKHNKENILKYIRKLS